MSEQNVPRHVAQVGTVEGRVLVVGRSPYFIHLDDSSTPRIGSSMNFEQAEQLVVALQTALAR